MEAGARDFISPALTTQTLGVAQNSGIPFKGGYRELYGGYIGVYMDV